MKIDMAQMILGLDSKPVKIVVGADEHGTPIIADASLRGVCVQALWNPMRGDENKTAEQKIKCAALAQRIVANDTVALSAEDIVLIKDRINQAYPHPGIVAGAYAMLDPSAPDLCGSVGGQFADARPTGAAPRDIIPQ